MPEGWNPFLDTDLLDRQVQWLRRAGSCVDGSSPFHVALRKLNIVSWETPLARSQLASASTLPYLVVYGRAGRPVRVLEGVDLDALDAAIAQGAGQ